LSENQGDCWAWTMEELGRYYETCAARHQPSPDLLNYLSPVERSRREIPGTVRDAIGLYLDAAATLGRRTAEMHLALAAPTEDLAFQPEPATSADLVSLAASFRANAVSSFDTLRANLASLPDDVVGHAGIVLSHRLSLLKRFDDLDGIEACGVKIRIHGNYHLGNELYVKSDYIIINFDGCAAPAGVEKPSKEPPLKDVASMLRSFSYAAYAGLVNYTARRPEGFRQLERWADLWEQWVSAAFLKSYRACAAGPVLPSDDSHFAALLDAYLLDRALREVRSELDGHPDRVHIPLRGVLALAERISAT